jgi:hypothetical protein
MYSAHKHLEMSGEKGKVYKKLRLILSFWLWNVGEKQKHAEGNSFNLTPPLAGYLLAM